MNKMDPIKQLEDKFSNESIDNESFRATELNECINTMDSYVKIDRSVAVMSDLADNKSYIFVGDFDSYFGMMESEYTTIDSIWEEDIYQLYNNGKRGNTITNYIPKLHE